MTSAAPFLDLKAATAEIAEPLAEAYARVLASGRYLLGPELEAFEDEWAAFCGAKHAVAVGSGLDAIWLALAARGIGPGDEVIVPGQTFVATWRAVTLVGAIPVPVDIDPLTHTIDVAAAAAAISERTAALLPVDLYGHPADHPALRELADRHGLFFLSDSAQAHGARLYGRPVASWADAACWSFYPGKNLGALGDGGAITTDDAQLAETARRLRNYGSKEKYVHVEQGVNSRLDEIQSAVLRVKLQHLGDWNDRRSKIAERYLAEIVATGVTLPGIAEGATPSWHLFAVTSERRDQLRDHLTAAGVETLIHYPLPPHLQPAYADYARVPLPVSERVAGSTLSLPIGPHLNQQQAQKVVDAVNTFPTS